MNQDRLRTLGWSVAGVLAAAGLLWSSATWINRGEPARRLTRRAADLRELQSLQRVVAHREAALARLRRPAVTGTNAPTLAAMIHGGLGAVSAALKELDPPAAPEGWSVRRVKVNLKDLSGDALGGLLAQLASNRPPWTVAECALKASSRPGWISEAELTLEQACLADAPPTDQK